MLGQYGSFSSNGCLPEVLSGKAICGAFWVSLGCGGLMSALMVCKEGKKEFHFVAPFATYVDCGPALSERRFRNYLVLDPSLPPPTRHLWTSSTLLPYSIRFSRKALQILARSNSFHWKVQWHRVSAFQGRRLIWSILLSCREPTPTGSS